MSDMSLLKRRIVRFAPMISVSPSNGVSPTEASQVWYTVTDLAGFKYNAKVAAYSFRMGTPSCEDVRGIESSTSARQTRRFLAVRCTLSAHRNGLSADETAFVAQRCTAWNAEVAFVQACHDYAEIYRPDLSRMIPEVDIVPPEFPFPYSRNEATRKRSAAGSTGADMSRRVRSRSCCGGDNNRSSVI